MNTEQHAPIKRTAFFRFYEELNDFLPEEQRNRLNDARKLGETLRRVLEIRAKKLETFASANDDGHG